MTPGEWTEVVRGIESRWPKAKWTRDTIAATYDYISNFDATDVWSAVHMWAESGEQWPEPMKFVKLVRDQAAVTARERQSEQYALTAPSQPPPEYEGSWYERVTAAHKELVAAGEFHQPGYHLPSGTYVAARTIPYTCTTKGCACEEVRPNG